MTISRRGALGAIAMAGVAGRTWATTATLPPATPALPPADAADVGRVVDYLQALSSAKGRFVQTDARGEQSEGVFFIQRPGHARFDYDPPSGLVIATDGQNVTVVDHRLKTIHAYPLALTPLALFLAKNIRLDRGVRVTQVVRGEHGFSVVAVDAHHKSSGEIALAFSESPLTLAGWTLRDGRGGVVRVRLAGLARAEPKDAAFFRLRDPHLPNDEPGPH